MSTFVHDIEAFLARTEMAESTFGRETVKDWRFVRQVRAGRRVWPETEARVRKWMAEYVAPSARPAPAPEQQAAAA